MKEFDQKGFTIIEAVVILLALALIAFGGKYVWDRHNAADIRSKANAGSYGALIGQYGGANAYACRGTYNVKITVWRANGNVSYSIVDSSSGPSYADFGGQYSKSWLYGVVQSYLVPYQSGRKSVIHGRLYGPDIPLGSSITAIYSGSRVYDPLLKGYLPATDGLPRC